jgi:hypothetical protein
MPAKQGTNCSKNGRREIDNGGYTSNRKDASKARKSKAAGVGTGRVASGIGYTIATARMPASSGNQSTAEVGIGRVASGSGYSSSRNQ